MKKIVLIFYLICWYTLLFGQAGISFGGGGGTSNIDTLANYTALNTYVSSGKTAVYINDFYSSVGGSASGQKWKVRGGLWVKVSNPGFVDGGTVRASNEGYYWQRQFDRTIFIPEYFEVDSANYNPVTVKLLDGGDAIRWAAYTAYTNYRAGLTDRTEASASIVLSPRKTYFHSKEMTLYGQNLYGNNARLFKKNAVVATSTSAATLGANFVDVASTAGFQVGMRVSVATGVASDQNTGHNLTIVSLTSTRITVDGVWVNATAPIGSTVFSHCVTLGMGGGYVNQFSGCVIRDLLFDGNVASNDYTYDWEFDYVIVATALRNVLVDNCHFFNITTDCVELGSGTVSNCTANVVWGNFTHYAGSEEVNDPKPGIYILNCQIDSVCIATDAVNGHSTGAFEHSGFVKYEWIENCRVTNSFQGIVGQITSEDAHVTIKNVQAENCEKIMLSGADNNSTVRNIRFENNDFKNCGDLNMAGGEDIQIVGNTFYNSRLGMAGFKNATITGNSWNWSSGKFATYTASTNSAAIDFSGTWYGLDFSNNTVQGDTVYDVDVMNGVMLALANTEISDTLTGGVIIKRLSRTRLNCHGNFISEFKCPLTTLTTGTPPANVTVSNWYIHDNIFVGSRKVSAYSLEDALGTFIPGCNIMRNTWEHQAETLDTVRLFVWGINPVTQDTARLLGSIVRDNDFIRTSIRNGYTATENNYNNIILDNTVSFPIWTLKAGKSDVRGNIVVNNTYLSPLTSRKPRRTIVR